MNFKFNKTIDSNQNIIVIFQEAFPELCFDIASIKTIMEQQEFRAKDERILHIPSTELQNTWVIGSKDIVKNYTTIASQISFILKGKKNIKNASIVIENASKDTILNIISELLSLRYKFNSYKKSEPKDEFFTDEITFITSDAPTEDELEFAVFRNNIIKQVRWMVDLPPNDLYPQTFVDITTKFLEPFYPSVKITILEEKELENERMNLLLAVGRTGSKPSRVMIAEFIGDLENPQKIALAGKGVTFDSGGYSLKPSRGMEGMKSDMSSAATIMGTLALCAYKKLKKNIVVIVGLVENMIGPDAYKVDDIIRSRSGKTVEIVNTDAEGRLVMADIYDYVQEKYTPTHLISAATMTATNHIFGDEFAILFSDNEELAQFIEQTGKRIDEKLWRLPLIESIGEGMKSKIADLRNQSSKKPEGYNISVAMFMKEFVKEGVKWAHMEVGDMTWQNDLSTGYGVRLLYETLNSLEVESKK
jgi:leucyl aminopeptidase